MRFPRRRRRRDASLSRPAYFRVLRRRFSFFFRIALCVLARIACVDLDFEWPDVLHPRDKGSHSKRHYYLETFRNDAPDIDWRSAESAGFISTTINAPVSLEKYLKFNARDYKEIFPQYRLSFKIYPPFRFEHKNFLFFFAFHVSF